MSKYINPYTDFGFKKLFGTEANKELLIDFLNEIVNENHKIKELTFNNTENFGDLQEDRKAIFDIYCTTINDEKIIIEMQKAKIKYFKDRAVFYTTFPIREQAQKGEWDFNLKPVYCIAILDFVFDKTKDHNDCRKEVSLKDQYCKEFYDKLKYEFIEMPRFNLKEDELTTHFEKWLYFLKHLETFDNIPAILKEPIFEKGFETAKIAALSREQHEAYEKSLVQYRDVKSAVDSAFDDGKLEGREEGLEQGIEQGREEGVEQGVKMTAKNMKESGVPPKDISKYTGLSIEEIENI